MPGGETDGRIDGNGGINEGVGAAATCADARDFVDAGDAFDDLLHAFFEAFGGAIDENVGGFFADAHGGEDHHARDAHRGEGIGGGPLGSAVFHAEFDDGEPAEDDDGGEEFGAEMEGVGFKRLAVEFFGGLEEHAGTPEIDGDGNGDDGHGGVPAIIDDHVGGGMDEMAVGFDENPEGGDGEDDGLCEGGEAFDFSVTVVVVSVGGDVGVFDAEPGDKGDAEIEGGVNAFGDEGEGAGENSDGELEDGKSAAGDGRGASDLDFFRHG